MDKIKISINLLRYCHSQALGELVNVGLLLYYTNKMEFRLFYLQEYSRLQMMYPNFSTTLFAKQMDFIQKRISEGQNSKAYNKTNQLDVISYLNSEILPRDSSQLQFGDDIIMHYPKENFDQQEFEREITMSYLTSSRELPLINNITTNQRDIEKDLSPWISPDYKNKIKKIKKDFIYLPRKKRL